MLLSRLLVAVVLLTTLATLPGPADGTFSYLALPAALVGFPVSRVALGLGVASVKIAIASRLLRFLFGLMSRGKSGPELGISVRKEFVHVPARDLKPPPLTTLVEPVHWVAPALPPPSPVPVHWARAPLPPPSVHWAPPPMTVRARALASAFSLPQPHGLPEQHSFVVGRSGQPAPPPGVASHPPPAFQPPWAKFVPSPPTPPPLHFVIPPPPAVALLKPGKASELHPVTSISSLSKASKTLLADAQPATGGTFDQILRIAQSPAVSTIASNNPELIVRLIQGISGAKPPQTPLGTAHSTAGLTSSKIGNGDIQALLGFVRQDPNLVRNIVRADPGFVPSLVNNLLGISGQRSKEPTPAPPVNSSDFDFKESNDTNDADSNVPANSPFEVFRFPSRAGDVEQPLFSRTPWHTPTLLRQLPDQPAEEVDVSVRKDKPEPSYYQTELTTAHPSSQADGTVQEDKPEPSYQTEATTELAITQAYGSGTDDKSGSSYDKPQPSTDPDAYNDPTEPTVEVFVINEEPELEPDVHTSEELTDDVHASPSDDDSRPLPSGGVQLVAEPPAKQTDASRRVFVPVTGKFRSDSLDDIPLNVDGSPAVPSNLTAHPVTQAEGRALGDQLKRSYQIEVTTKLPTIQAHETGRNYKPQSSYDKPESSTRHESSNYKPESSSDKEASKDPVEPDVQVVVTEQPVVEQDLPASDETKGDVYASANNGDHSSLPPGEKQHAARPTVKQTPPPVRTVFSPVTGQYRFGPFGISGPGKNVAGFPFSLYDPTDLDTEAPKSGETGPRQEDPKPRVRRTAPSPDASGTWRSMNSRA
ncbi:hypothetical protein V5799_012024 [Amblyomma americanum]|uniref:Uncharacterized protein n=1 Tax=Amblyomma americanum TaxID=6943 RepID=A0AAQ4EFN2_AMBAM